ncbi:hypothetical protein K4039_05290 [Lyngbya sp. CCAP 1446/10]|uniref:hypothetical protein n=1 Tax=Lyngbya sp. CCAP 1446/10 TaxID=439293 RepID=UPI002238FDE2|nr:hypothetical protein [Lyngbya sp. CCAP 1446/10]MCW6049503.1 hypothetical protein [Lyngbya sp. CCAP 1446/10]
MAAFTVTKAPGFCIDAAVETASTQRKSELRGTEEKNAIFNAALQPAIQAGFVCIDAVSTARPSDILNDQ